MKNTDIEMHICQRESERDDSIKLELYLEDLCQSVGLSEPTKSELKAKISSRMAFIDRSIRDHEVLV